MLSVAEYDGPADYLSPEELIMMDRGDGVAQAVLDRNARSLAQRMADETREELARVLQRVDKIYGSFEETMFPASNSTNLEYVSSTDELEQLISDPTKKKKYQKQVTVFIVGYQSTCTQKFRLLQQVNDFFIDNANTLLEPDDDPEPAEEVDLDAVGNAVEESIEYAQSLAQRLGEINHDLYEFAAAHAGAKGNKGKKKLEKQLNSAREELASLNEKLAKAHVAVEEKEEKIQGLYKTVELRTSESQRFRTAAEAAKKSVQEADRLRLEVAKQEEKLLQLTDHIAKLELEREERDQMKIDEMTRLAETGAQAETKISAMKEELEHQQNHFERLTSDLVKEHDRYVSKLRSEADKQFVDMQETHSMEKMDMEDKIEELTRQLLVAKQNVIDVEEQLHREKTNAGLQSSTPTTSMSKKSRSTVASKKQSSTASKKEQPSIAQRQEMGIQYSIQGSPSPGGEVMDFEDEIDLDADEELWMDLPKHHVTGRFKQYREMSRARVGDMEKEIQDLVEKMQRKVMTLKTQYNEHKGRWEGERKHLMDQIEAAMKLQTSAEKDTDHIMETLEKFVDEQEQIEAPSRLKTRATSRADNLTDDDKSKLDDHDDPEHEVKDEVEQDMGSARSRATSRSKAKSAIEDRKASITDRRTNTPKSQKSGTVLSEMTLDEDGDIPIPDDTNEETEEKGGGADEEMAREDSLDLIKVPSTAGPKVSSDIRHSYTIADHPVVKEFLKVYALILEFKEKVASVSEKEELSALPAIEFDKTARVHAQLETMTKQVSEILKIIVLVLTKPGKQQRLLKAPQEFHASTESVRSLEAGQISVLQQQISRLEQIIQDSTDKYENELNKNREQIGKLESKNASMKRELSSLGRVVDDTTPQKMVQDSEVPIMFTRLDMERNGKIMKRAVYNDKLEKDKYKDALGTMDSYVSIPARRFVHLVRKYVHHRQMREIEDNVKKSHSLNDSVFNILDKMEALQNVRAQRWADYMDNLSSERVNLAQLLMQTLDEIEQESGIFLIKPIYSLKGRDPISSIYSKYGHASANRRRTPAVLKQTTDETPRPEPPPRSPPSKMGYRLQTAEDRAAQENQTTSLLDKGSVWVAPLSEAHRRKYDESQTANMLNTPRILELDINRMLISQNAISARMDTMTMAQLGTDATLRNYVTINRPQATQLSKDKTGMSVGGMRLSLEKEPSKLPPI